MDCLFQKGDRLKVKLDVTKIKPELRGKTCEIINCNIYSIYPYLYTVKIENKEYVFKGNEMQSIYQYDKDLLNKWNKINQK
jgi:hypothetical protein